MGQGHQHELLPVLYINQWSTLSLVPVSQWRGCSGGEGLGHSGAFRGYAVGRYQWQLISMSPLQPWHLSPLGLTCSYTNQKDGADLSRPTGKYSFIYLSTMPWSSCAGATSCYGPELLTLAYFPLTPVLFHDSAPSMSSSSINISAQGTILTWS